MLDHWMVQVVCSQSPWFIDHYSVSFMDSRDILEYPEMSPLALPAPRGS